MTIALVQIYSKSGDVNTNLEKHLSLIAEARGAGEELIVFPELSLTGYALQGMTPSVAYSPTVDNPIFRHLIDASKDIDVVVGFVDEDARHRFFIAGAYLSQGTVLQVHHEVYPPYVWLI